MERTEALKPCPFCKGGATLTANGLFDMRYQVQCDTCYSSTGASTNADKVIAHWNTRSTPAPANKDEQYDIIRVRGGLNAEFIHDKVDLASSREEADRIVQQYQKLWGNVYHKKAQPTYAVDYEAGARAFTTTLSSLGFPVPHRSDVLQAATACINAALQPAAKEG